MQVCYCQHLITQRPCHNQASGWLAMGREREKMGLKFQGPISEDPRQTTWQLIHAEVERQVFNNKCLRAIQTSGWVTRVQ